MLRLRKHKPMPLALSTYAISSKCSF